MPPHPCPRTQARVELVNDLARLRRELDRKDETIRKLETQLRGAYAGVNKVRTRSLLGGLFIVDRLKWSGKTAFFWSAYLIAYSLCSGIIGGGTSFSALLAMNTSFIPFALEAWLPPGFSLLLRAIADVFTTIPHSPHLIRPCFVLFLQVLRASMAAPPGSRSLLRASVGGDALTEDFSDVGAGENVLEICVSEAVLEVEAVGPEPSTFFTFDFYMHDTQVRCVYSCAMPDEFKKIRCEIVGWHRLPQTDDRCRAVCACPCLPRCTVVTLRPSCTCDGTVPTTFNASALEMQTECSQAHRCSRNEVCQCRRPRPWCAA